MEVLKYMMNVQVDPMFNESDFEYRLYLQDHRQLILDQCNEQLISTDNMATFEYRMKEYLYVNDYPVAAYWLVLWINNLDGQQTFKKLKRILLPNLSQIEDLYQQYRTLRSEWTNAKKKMNNS